ncbi:hypothetical protein [Candidatus Parabeggiatoa sp. HSG14]|nr:hypothetical protein [Thiotrichales bacterium HSG14]
MERAEQAEIENAKAQKVVQEALDRAIKAEVEKKPFWKKLILHL